MRGTDVLIVGGGPAGLAAALYACRSGLSVTLVEMTGAGGQILRTSEIANYPGFPKGVSGWELAEALSTHLDGYELNRLTDTVSAVESSDGGYRAVLSNGEVMARTVILCQGAAPRPLGVADEARFVGRGVSYCALCDGNFFRGCDVAVVGGGNSALEESLYLAGICRKVYLIHRREAFRGARVVVDKVRATPNVELVLGSVVVGLNGDQSLRSVDVADLSLGARRTLDVEGLFVFVGCDPRRVGLPSAVRLDDKGFVVTDTEMRTDLPGVFAAGDIRSKACRQVATAVGDGATAATSAFAYIQQEVWS